MKLFVKYKNGSVEIVNVSKLSYHKKNPCLKCRKGGERLCEQQLAGCVHPAFPAEIQIKRRKRQHDQF